MLSPPAAAFLIDTDEAFYRAVVCPLDIVGKIARGQFAVPAVVGYAFAADAFSGTGFVAAVAAFFVLFNGTGSHGAPFYGRL